MPKFQIKPAVEIDLDAATTSDPVEVYRTHQLNVRMDAPEKEDVGKPHVRIKIAASDGSEYVSVLSVREALGDDAELFEKLVERVRFAAVERLAKKIAERDAR